jgi:predicted nucleotidyltransferase component of viral defense system
MSNPNEGLAHSVQVRLVAHAKKIGVEPNLVLTRYGVERFLYRLSRSLHAERFVLKGALLLMAWLGETLRPTRDADLLGFGDLTDGDLVRILRDVCAMEVEPDAMTFLAESVQVEPIRVEDAYGGRRAAIEARLGKVRLIVQVDIGIGDAVTPAPEWMEYPGLLDLPRARLRVYPRESVVAEKLHAMVLLGTRNTRMKDYFDLRALAREGALDPHGLVDAIAATFARRRTAVPDGVPSGLSEEFANDGTSQAQWKAFLTRNRLEGPPFETVVREVREFASGPLRRARQRVASA